MKKVKVKDFRQGKTMYHVMAFPLEDKMKPSVTEYRIQSRAYLKPSGDGVIGEFLKGTQWFKLSYVSSWSGKLMTMEHSVRDSGVGVGKTSYNFHRMFHTRKQAQRYADRMASGCLTHEERKHAMMLNERHRIIDSMSSWYDW